MNVISIKQEGESPLLVYQDDYPDTVVIKQVDDVFIAKTSIPELIKVLQSFIKTE